MNKVIIIAVVSGILAGVFIDFRQIFLDLAGYLIMAMLCLLLLLIGVEMGKDTTLGDRVRQVGARIFLFPVAAILGTYIFAAAASFVLPIGVRGAIAVSGGFGWYSFAPTILMAHSVTLSAICFLHNVIRELLGIILIPVVAKRIGYIEATTLPGVAVMDICLPIIEKEANSNTVVYAIVMGMSMVLAVPLVGVIAG